MAENFSFLTQKFPILAKFGTLAEQYLYSDPNSCLIKLRMLGETVVNLIFRYEKIAVDPELNAAKRIDVLRNEGVLEEDFTDVLHILRKKGNMAAHENYDSAHDAEICLRMAYRLCEWFMQVYGDWQYENKPFILPVKQNAIPVVQAAAAELTPEEKQLAANAEKAADDAKTVAKEERRKQSHAAAAKSKKSEEETRYIIDQNLRRAGWEVDSKKITYANGCRPEKGRNYIISEWPTDSGVYKNGYADYAQFIGTKLVGIIEAKAEHKDIPSALDGQAKDYASHIKGCDQKYVVGTYGKYKVPFAYATNGRPYIEQFKIKSGIWFQDLRRPDNAPRAIKGWYRPEDVAEMLSRDIAEKEKALEAMPKDFLKDPDGLNLRPYQLLAIDAAEKAIRDGKRSILLALATGTGKTRLVLGLIYRFLKSKRFRRILFVVDRNALGGQAMDTFKSVRLEELMPITDIYDVKSLDDTTFEKETKVQVATVQGLVKRLLYNDSDDPKTALAVSDYDLIIVDEAHRGYILDKEMSEAEQLYRNQADYQSKYRQVIEFFDAVKIGLTATPALQTTEIFGEPIYTYTYREAVIDGWLIDHDAPYTMETELSKNGIHFDKGEKVKVLLPDKDGQVDTARLDDELNFDVDDFNKRVITESFNRVVLETIARDIDPEEPKQGKTLIYAANDLHADLIVSILKEIYGGKGVDTDSILKITGAAFGGNREKIKEAIRKFKNERFPSIVVTVDLLTTGIDVPSITTLVFMRRVKSRILFEQMLGRATRQCPEIKKECFRIYDPVGTYGALEPVTNMKPVVTNVTTTFANLVEGLQHLTDETAIRQQVAQLLAKLQRKKRRMKDEDIKDFSEAANIANIDKFVEAIRAAKPEHAKILLLNASEAIKSLDEIYSISTLPPKVISEKKDTLISVGRGYGETGQKPEDYIEAFTDFIRTHVNEVTALKIVCTRPADLTRSDLKSLRKELARHDFTEKQLNSAYGQVTNAEIAADIISMVRKAAIGSALVSKEDRIHNAIQKLKAKHDFEQRQLNWLGRIEDYLLNESVLHTETFNEDSRFRAAGGFSQANKVFGNKLEDIVKEINTYLYEDGGHTA